ncbi:ABC transporter permease [Arthrobacter bambusae]|uniref:ABC transporter permease n=1 Tax=Arthrobacter bambusae TaxID=1338426 RepID=UPI0027842363|nr:ABC transporter permease [Arthrobacter bambusae]MDQ0029059.1 ribose/xylose/arabinose/galactoside ABC-type transport system permease subunit [Arthrobacter bambusae]MDQ0098539.1 ribose/xylose/arabinose/galactoside ABC-type transport system permease subunit [Arthrobacter bambusae]
MTLKRKGKVLRKYEQISGATEQRGWKNPVSGPGREKAPSGLITDLKYRFPGRYIASWGALALALLVIALVVPVTLRPDGLRVSTALAGVLALASLGQMLVVMLGAIDLSVPAVITCSAGVVVHYGTQGANLLAVVGVALAVSVVISLLNWLFISVIRLNAIIVTLATFGIVTGAVVLWTGASFSMTGLAPTDMQNFTHWSFLGLNACFIVAVVVGVIIALVLSKTRGGRQIAAIGSNRRAARFHGINVRRIEFFTFGGVGLLYGLAGVLVAGFVVTPDTSVGTPYQLATITAVAIAGTAFNGGPSSAASVVCACLFLQLLDQALSIYGFAAGPRVVAQGVALVLAVSAITLGQFALSGLRWGNRGIHRGGGRNPEQGVGSKTTPSFNIKETI